jgi:hypothetical protein
MKTTYKAVLFHPEGDYVQDFRDSETIEDVQNELMEMGSRWIFYPIAVVVNQHTNRIVDVDEYTPQWWINKGVTTLQKYLRKEWRKRADEICEGLNAGDPLHVIY